MMKVSLYLLILFLFVQSCGIKEANTSADQTLKEKFIQIGKRCYDRELFWGTGGDISVRVPGTDQFLIKASMTCIGDLDESRISLVDLNGKHLNGPTPSHETPIHVGIYNLQKDVDAILHMHAPFSTAWATAGLKIPAVTQQSVTILKNCGIIPYYPVGSEELVTHVLEFYKNNDTRVVFMENHGVFVVGKDLNDLFYNAEKVENTARIAYYCKALGTPKSFEAVTVY